MTRNRAAVLAECLCRLRRQTRQPDEILVVDDSSTDDTKSICTAVSGLRYIRLPRAHGYIYGRNLGYSTTSCDFTLSLDDDSWFIEDDALERAVALLSEEESAALLAFNIHSVSGAFQWRVDTDVSPVYTFTGCGYLLRNDALGGKVPYEEFFEGHGEEKLLSVRLYAEGWSVLRVPNIAVHHAQSMLERNWPRIRFREHRNDILREITTCPTKMLPGRLLKIWLAHTYYNLRHGHWWTDLRVLLSMPRMVPVALRARAAVSVQSYNRWMELRHEDHARVD